MRIVFHGSLAAVISDGFEAVLEEPADVILLPDNVSTAAECLAYETADCIVSTVFNAELPMPSKLKMFHVAGAGYEKVDLSLLPPQAVVCNCFGHETAIAEYAIGAILMDAIPYYDADRRLRRGDWYYGADHKAGLHSEVAGLTVGLLGFGHIGRAIAKRAKAFEMRVHAASRNLPPLDKDVDGAWRIDALDGFWSSFDYLVISLPLTDSTRGLVGADAFASMRQGVCLINVGRGPTVDEDALYEALQSGLLKRAIIDTWYVYPVGANPTLPANRDFKNLPNIIMTPHMSGWTNGMIRRRQKTIANNIARLLRGEPCVGVIRASVHA